ncbi:hypothetical protein Bhyg_00520 [Pseudolycoriella hygida]|uniref:Uncharacterized protein n=1 Tax=Pseudolycoriella hygida TaxID=35572 RepID=A0A9Q0N7V9_9DIPT|nr:hypothetical protein Bhyg_00520 [Pseudolycoriella hygida]
MLFDSAHFIKIRLIFSVDVLYDVVPTEANGFDEVRLQEWLQDNQLHLQKEEHVMFISQGLFGELE